LISNFLLSIHFHFLLHTWKGKWEDAHAALTTVQVHHRVRNVYFTSLFRSEDQKTHIYLNHAPNEGAVQRADTSPQSDCHCLRQHFLHWSHLYFKELCHNTPALLPYLERITGGCARSSPPFRRGAAPALELRVGGGSYLGSSARCVQRRQPATNHVTSWTT